MSNEKHSGYRPDIDGLRAFAVLSVILYHASQDTVPGGYIGVDVFFVISGFVVTKSILSSQTGHVWTDMVNFWRRRILRIFPILAVVTLATVLLASAFIAPVLKEGYNANFRTAMAAMLGLANIYLYRHSFQYFRGDHSESPLMHTWSLGIEEQFYFAIGVLFLVAHRLYGPATTFKRASIRTLIIIIGLSLWSYQLDVVQNPTAAFFLPYDRFWELGLGCFLAFQSQQTGFVIRRKLPAGLAQGFAIVTVIGALFLANYPYDRVLIAVVASGLLIAANPSGSQLVTRTLSGTAPVYVGKISYSLYLWHWPVFVFFEQTVGLRGSFLIIALLLIFCLSAASYEFIERPCRNSSLPLLTSVLPRAGTMSVIIGGLSVIAQLWPGFMYVGRSQDWTNDWRAPRDHAYVGTSKITMTKCHLTNGSVVPDQIPEDCDLTIEAASAARRKLLLVGDSHAQALWAMGTYVHASEFASLATLTHDGCSIAATGPSSCIRYWQVMLSNVERLNAGDIVLLSLQWPLAPTITSPLTTRAIEHLATTARAHSISLIIEAPPPQFQRSALYCSPEWFRTDISGCSVPLSEFKKQRADVIAMLNGIRYQYENVLIWDPVPTLCGSESCSLFRRGKPLFVDKNHISLYGARLLGPAFSQFLKNALRTS